MNKFRIYDGDDIDGILCKKYHNYLLISTLLPPPSQVGRLMIVECTTSEYHNFFVVDINGGVARIHNAFYFQTDELELGDFVRYLFENFGVRKIRWARLYEPLPTVSYKRLSYCSISDNIAELPDTFNDYLNSLGKQTKKHSKYYLGRLERDFQAVEYQYVTGAELPRATFNRICDFARGRMAYKSLSYGGGDETLWRGIQHPSGFAYLISIGGEVKASCVGYILGEHLYLSKIAHDVSLNKYNLGNIVLLKLIEHCIENHIRYFHFLWGEGVDYKVRYGGIPHRLTEYTLYRYADLHYYADAVLLGFKKLKHNLANAIRKNKGAVKAYHKSQQYVKVLCSMRKGES